MNMVVGAGLLVVATGALVTRFVPINNHLSLYAVVASPYLMVAAPIAMVVLLLGHRWLLAVLALGLSIALAALQVPWYVASTPSPDAVRIRVMSINMLYGRADAQSIVEIARAQADVVLVQEFPPDAAQRLTAAGLEQTFPYQALDTLGGAQGAGIYSRYPISSTAKIEGYALAMISARLRVDGLTRDPTVVSVHLAAPWPQSVDAWRNDLAKLPTTLADLADRAKGGAVLVGGDFNSTIDMQPFRNLLTNGYADSADQAGAGRLRSYPSNERIPPFMGIDHLLVRDATATTTSTTTVKDSDHRTLLATVMAPRG